jgi:hypothetical protein
MDNLLNFQVNFTYTDIWKELTNVKQALDKMKIKDLIKNIDNIDDTMFSEVYKVNFTSIKSKYLNGLTVEKTDIDFLKVVYIMYYTRMGYDVDYDPNTTFELTDDEEDDL